MGKVALCIKSDRLTELRGRKSNLDAFFCFENYYPGRGKLKRYISPLNNVVAFTTPAVLPVLNTLGSGGVQRFKDLKWDGSRFMN